MGRSGSRVQRNFSSIGKGTEIGRNNEKVKGLSSAIKEPAQKMKVLLMLIFAFCPMSYASKVTIHKRTVNFLDIEGSTSNFWVGCSGMNKKDDIAYMGFYLIEAGKSWYFHYRRPLGYSQCLSEQSEYRKMIKHAKTIRIVGISQLEENGPEPRDPQIPERFTNVKKRTSSFFSRLQVGKQCKAYFEDDCDLPENYWANTIPDNYGK